MARPLIGVTTYVERASWGHWDAEAALVPYDYVRAVERAGGRAVLVPPDDDGVDEVLDALDGLIFSGGNDLEPEGYGADAHPATVGTNPERDRGELALLKAALDRDLPVLAICRGFQLLNVARGGDLIQHLPEEVGHDVHKPVPGEFALHPVEIKPGTRLSAIVDGASHVTSHHHQAIGRIGDGLVETAWADDGTLEALEDPSQRFVVGVQWHPEATEDHALFEALVEEAREYRAARAK